MEIKSDIPRPERKAGAPIKYPFEKMEVDQCFEYELKEGEDLKTIQRSIHSTAKQRGYVVSTSTEGRKITVWLDGIC